jgi:hypothetical protein
MSSSEEEEVQAVAYLEVRERTSNGKGIMILKQPFGP